MRNFIKFPCKEIFKVSFEQFAPLRSAVAVRRSKHSTSLIADSLSLPFVAIDSRNLSLYRNFKRKDVLIL